MKKFTYLFSGILCLMIAVPSYAVTISYQDADIDRIQQQQQGGHNNISTTNNLNINSNYHLVKNRVKSNSTTLTQRGGHNNEMSLNRTRISGHAGVHQSADIKKLRTVQQGGSNNTMAVNTLEIE